MYTGASPGHSEWGVCLFYYLNLREENAHRKMTRVERSKRIQGPWTHLPDRAKMQCPDGGQGAKPGTFWTIFKIMGLRMKHLTIYKAF